VPLTNFNLDSNLLRETATVHEESKEGLLAIAAALEGVAIPDGSVWIGSNDKLVHKIAKSNLRSARLNNLRIDHPQ
jgi:hypothetical protein